MENGDEIVNEIACEIGDAHEMWIDHKTSSAWEKSLRDALRRHGEDRKLQEADVDVSGMKSFRSFAVKVFFDPLVFQLGTKMLIPLNHLWCDHKRTRDQKRHKNKKKEET